LEDVRKSTAISYQIRTIEGVTLFFAFTGILVGIMEYEISYFKAEDESLIWLARVILLSVTMGSTIGLIFVLLIRYLLII
jgi:hypothetical protein